MPSPQSIELHMALKRLGVPTELFMYPGQSHGIPDTRNQFVKIDGRDGVDGLLRPRQGKKFAWRSVLDTLDEPGTKTTKPTDK